MFVVVRFMSLLFLFACQLVRGLRGMAQQHDLFTQLRLRMEEAEANLSTMREENEAL